MARDLEARLRIGIDVQTKGLDNLQKALENFSKKSEGSLKRLGENLDSITKSRDLEFKTDTSGLDKTEKSLKRIRQEVRLAARPFAQEFAEGLAIAAGGIGALDIAMNRLGDASTKAFRPLLALPAGLSESAKQTSLFSDFIFKLRNGLKVAGSEFLRLNSSIFALPKTLGVASAGFLSLSKTLQESESSLVRFLSQVSFAISIITGALSVAIVAIITKIGSLTQSIGTGLVKATQAAAKEFAKFEKSTLVFTRTVEGFNRQFGSGAGDIEFWQQQVGKAAQETNFLEKDLQTAAVALLEFGALNDIGKDQLSELFKVAQDYATITGDVVGATQDFAAFLGGNNQALQKYQLFINNATLANFAYKEGITDNIEKLSQSDKAQLRYNKVLSIYPTIAGKAAAVAGTLSGQQERLEKNLTEISTKFGAGASIINNFNLSAAASNIVLGSINDSVFSALGFLGALGGRLLQLIGTFLKWSFAIFTVQKAFIALEFFLKLDATQSAFGKSIPFLNQSINDFASSVTGLDKPFADVRTSFETLGTVFSAKSKEAIASFLGLEASALTVSTGMSAAFKKASLSIRASFRVIGNAGKALLANPIFLIGATLAGIVLALGKAFQFIEERTGFFSTIGNAFKPLLTSAGKLLSVFKPLQGLFESLINIIGGIFISVVANALQIVTSFASGAITAVNTVREAFGGSPIGTEFQKGLDEANAKVVALRRELQGGTDNLFNANLSNLEEPADRSIASTNRLGQSFGPNISDKELEKRRKAAQKAAEEARKRAEELAREREEILKILDQINLENQQSTGEVDIDLVAKVTRAQFEDELEKARKFGFDTDPIEQKIALTIEETQAAAIQQNVENLLDRLTKAKEQANDLTTAVGAAAGFEFRANFSRENAEEVESAVSQLEEFRKTVQSQAVANNIDEILLTIKAEADDALDLDLLGKIQNVVDATNSVENELKLRFEGDILDSSLNDARVRAQEKIDQIKEDFINANPDFDLSKFELTKEKFIKDNEEIRDAIEFSLGEATTKELTNGLGGALNNIVDGTKTVADSFKDMVDNIIKSLTKQALSNALGQVVSNLNFADGGQVPVVSTQAVKDGGLIQGFAKGGKIPRFARGGKFQRFPQGLLSGPGGPRTDSILARVSAGEYVSDARTTNFFGAKFFKNLKGLASRGINPFQNSALADGGVVSSINSINSRLNRSSSIPGFMEGGVVPRSNDSEAIAVTQHINIVNEGTGKQVERVERDAATNQITRIILGDIQGNGPISQNIQGAYGLRRSGSN